MGKLLEKYRLRLERKKIRIGSLRRRSLVVTSDDFPQHPNSRDIFLFVALGDSAPKQEFFEYYFALGITHIFCVSSTDLQFDPIENVSIWHCPTKVSKSQALNILLARFGPSCWCLTLDEPEYLIYPHMDCRPLSALADWMRANNKPSLGAIKGIAGNPKWVSASIEVPYENLNLCDASDPLKNTNVVPFVDWKKPYSYRNGNKSLLPRGLNRVYKTDGRQDICALLLPIEKLPQRTDWKEFESMGLLSRGQWA